jgi:hypothetical protein
LRNSWVLEVAGGLSSDAAGPARPSYEWSLNVRMQVVVIIQLATVVVRWVYSVEAGCFVLHLAGFGTAVTAAATDD